MAGLPVFGTNDILTLGADWEVTGQSLDGGNFARATAVGADGDVVASQRYDGVSSSVGRISGTITAVYVGAEVTYAAAIAGFEPGNNASGYTITGFSVDYSPCAAGSRETCTFTITNQAGLSADSEIFKPSLTTELPTKQESVGIPNILTKAGADSEPTGATYSIICQIGNTLGADGNDITGAGATYNGEETITQTYTGAPGAITMTGWDITQTGAAETNSNSGYDTYSASASKSVIRE